MKIVAEMKKSTWDKGMGETNSIIFVRKRNGLYISSLSEYIHGESIKWQNDDLHEAINYHSRYCKNRRIFIYE